MKSVTQFVFYFLYRSLIFPLAMSLFWLLRFFNQKVHEGFVLRQNQPWLQKKLSGEVLWIHCASGEIEYAKPVIRELKNQNPKQKILVTYFSPSVVGNLSREPLIDFFCPLPWDSPLCLKEFIQFHKPRALLIARTDLWPEVLFQCRRLGVKTILFSSTFKEKISIFQRAYLSVVLPILDFIFVVSPEDLKNLKTLTSSTHAEVLGDTRYDQCIFRLSQPSRFKQELLPLNFIKPILVAGSTWPEDEKVLLDFFESTQNKVNLILVPHEPNQEHLAELSASLNSKQIKFIFYSQAQSWNEGEVLIVDEIGLLANTYSFAQFAFVGGSFKKSVHSVMEPLAAGLQVYVGPYHQNNREALFFKQVAIDKTFPVIEINTAADWKEKFLIHLNEWGSMQSEQLIKKIHGLTGASKVLIKKMGELYNSPLKSSKK